MREIQNIVILTGAGISAESGVATFRGPGGLWEGHRVEDVATPEAYVRDPDLVLGFYDARRAALDGVAPNPAHHALGRLDAAWPGDLLIVTQNVDDLHERAGTKRLLHMHGELKSALCAASPMPKIRNPKVSAFSTALRTSKRCAARRVSGSTRKASTKAITPNGTFTANSHCQVPSDRMPAATVGPIAVETATTSALLPTPRPSLPDG